MTIPKFQFKVCDCDQYDSVCSCYNAAKYEYLKTELQKMTVFSYTSCGDDIKEAIKELLAEVEKPYEDARVHK